MRGEERKRAGRNRTLSVTGEEVEQLRDLVSTLSDIERGENVLNKIIHADLLAMIESRTVSPTWRLSIHRII